MYELTIGGGKVRILTRRHHRAWLLFVRFRAAARSASGPLAYEVIELTHNGRRVATFDPVPW